MVYACVCCFVIVHAHSRRVEERTLTGSTAAWCAGDEFQAATHAAEAEARRKELDDEEAKKLMPRIDVRIGGWQIPLRSSWPLRALWQLEAARRRGVAGGAVLDAGAVTALSRFVGEDVLALLPIGKPAKKAGSNAAGAEVGFTRHETLVRSLVGAAGTGTSTSESSSKRKAKSSDAIDLSTHVEVTSRLEHIGPQLIQDLPRLPCASLLLRVLVNPSEGDMMAVLNLAGHVG